MRFLLITSLLFISFDCSLNYALANSKHEEPQKKQLMKLEETVELSGSLEEVFAFAANPVNDHFWRNEVKKMELDGEFEVGSILTETAFLPLNPNFITVTEITELEHNKYIAVQTLEGDTYFRVERSFKETQRGVSMTYKIEADIQMVKDILGFSMPLALAKIYYGTVLKLYVNNLKRFLKKNDLSQI